MGSRLPHFSGLFLKHYGLVPDTYSLQGHFEAATLFASCQYSHSSARFAEALSMSETKRPLDCFARSGAKSLAEPLPYPRKDFEILADQGYFSNSFQVSLASHHCF